MPGATFDVIVVGAGIAGLAVSIALTDKGHRVTVLDAAPALSEIGAGIQVPPNSVKLLKRMGVFDEIAKLATWPLSISIKRWIDGSEIGSTPLFPAMEENYGYPYLLIHRGDLHKVLLNKAVEVGVTIKIKSFVTSVDEQEPSVTVAEGTKYKADLVIGADGVKSWVRRAVINEREAEIVTEATCIYRTIIPGEKMLSDPALRPFIEAAKATFWVGPKSHVVAYPIRHGAQYNFVMCHPGIVPVGVQNETASLEELREFYKDWDPTITRLINLVPECLKWANAELEKLETWTSKSGRVVLIGDASHAMTPHMAQGAAMAIEDAVAVTECLSRANGPEDIPQLMKDVGKIRRDRCYLIADSARATGANWHLPDGPEQQRRDEAIKRGSKPKVSEETGANPNKWSDPNFQPWMFGYDAFSETNSYLDKHSATTDSSLKENRHAIEV